MVSYKITKDAILNHLKDNALSFALDPDNIIEAGKESSDQLPMPFVYCVFDFGEAKTLHGYICDLTVDIYVGCESDTAASAKEQADEFASKILRSLVDSNLVQINSGDKFKEFFAESSTRSGIVLHLKSIIQSH